MQGLEGKSILVTGGGSGIGREVCFLLAESGAKVTIADIHTENAQATVDTIIGRGQIAQSCVSDVCSETAACAAVAAAVDQFGRLDGACNAAGVSQRGKPLHELSLEEWDLCHSINLRGLFLCNKYEIAALLKTGGGSIVNISSTTGNVGIPNGSEYCASKAGVLGLTRAAAIDYATQGIRLNAVLPGATLTPMLSAAVAQDPGLEAAIAAVHPMNRFGQPAEIASAVRWLLSDESTFTTGASFTIDGGHTAM